MTGARVIKGVLGFQLTNLRLSFRNIWKKIDRVKMLKRNCKPVIQSPHICIYHTIISCMRHDNFGKFGHKMGIVHSFLAQGNQLSSLDTLSKLGFGVSRSNIENKKN